MKTRCAIWGTAFLAFFNIRALAAAAPSITTQPASQTVIQGNPVTFTVTASGSGPLAYQWQFNGTNLPDDLMITAIGNGVAGYSGDGGVAGKAMLNSPNDVVVDTKGNLFIADTGNNRIREVDTNGIIITVAGSGASGFSGDGGAATNASLNSPRGICFDSAGDLFIADSSNNCIREVDINGIISTVVGSGTSGYSGDGGPATNASLNLPSGICSDSGGNLFIADEFNNRVRKVGLNGIITTVAGNGTSTWPDTGNGGPATNATLASPTGVAVDGWGNLLIAEAGNGCYVRKVNTNGIISIVAGNGNPTYGGDGGNATNASLYVPWNVCLDSSDDLFIADEVNNRIREVDTNGIITTVAGNGSWVYNGDDIAATNAALNGPLGVAVDALGDLFIADTYDHRVREVEMTRSPALTFSGVTTNLAGSYRVIVSNADGSITSTVATLTILLPPTIVNQPSDTGVFLGNSASFAVTATGDAPLSYRWLFDGAPLSDGSQISGSTTNLLTIKNVQATNAGAYQVVITNASGSVTSSIATLFIARTRYVNVNNPTPSAPYTNWATAATVIQNAIDVSHPGDWIFVTDGTYASGGRVVYGAATNRVAVDRPITLESVNGPQVTVIQGVSSPVSATIRCAYLTNGAALVGFTLKNGSSRNSGDWLREQSGGGVWCESASAVVSNCILTQNYAHSDGGGAVSGTLNSCTFSGNKALEGGGAYSAKLNTCILSGNSATWGGGAYYGSLINCSLSDNSARDPGGTREGEGGGGYSCNMTNCILTSNSARVGGGGASWGTLVNCLVANNSALQGGGASACGLVDCTVVGNSAPTDGGVGGGLGGGLLSCSAENSIIVLNSATFGGGDYYDSSFSYCCSSSNPGGTGNIVADPLFRNYAGGDYSLQSNSPCINSGNNAYVASATDLDGNPRIQGGTADMGAYEYQTPVSQISYAWLQQYGLRITNGIDTADLDGTGFDVYQDWIAGLNPTNALSVLAMLPPIPTNNPAGLVVSWESVSNRTYFLQSSTNLAAHPAFSTIQSNIVGQPDVTSFMDANAIGSGPFFYRVGVQQ